MTNAKGTEDVVAAIFNKHRKQLANQNKSAAARVKTPKVDNHAPGTGVASKPYERPNRSAPTTHAPPADSWKHDLFPHTVQPPSLASRLQIGPKDLLPGSQPGMNGRNISGGGSGNGGTGGMRSFLSSSSAVPTELLPPSNNAAKVPRELLGRPLNKANGIGPDRRPRLAVAHQPAIPATSSGRLYPASAISASLYPTTQTPTYGKQPRELLGGGPQTRPSVTSSPVELISTSTYSGPRAPPVPLASAISSGADGMDVDDDEMQGLGSHGRDGMAIAGSAGTGLKAGEVKVVVEGLVLGTTDEDVWSAFSSHFPLKSAHILESPAPPCPNTPTVPLPPTRTSAELILPSAKEASLLVERFNGILADDYNLRVYVWSPPAPRIGLGKALAVASGQQGRAGPNRLQQALTAAPSMSGRSKVGPLVQSPAAELLPGTGIGRMYSDEILQSDPRARVVTLGEGPAQIPTGPRRQQQQQQQKQPVISRPSFQNPPIRNEDRNRLAGHAPAKQEPVKRSLISRIGGSA